MATIHDRVKVIKNLVEISTESGGGDESTPKHGGTHAKKGTDPTPQEVDGVPIDLDGIVDGQALVFDESENKIIPGEGGGGGGEANTTSNAGTGVGIALAKVGVDLPLASLTSAGGTVDISLDGDNLNLETIGTSSNATSIQSVPVEIIPTNEDLNGLDFRGIYRQNKIKESETFNTSPWNKTRMTVNTSTGIASPIDGVDYQGLVASVDDNDHFVWQQATWISEDRLSFGLYIKYERTSLCTLRVITSSNSIAVQLNLTTGAVKQTIGEAQFEVEEVGTNEYKFTIYSEQETTEIPIFRIIPAEIEGDDDYIGDGSTIDVYVTGAHVTNRKIAEKIGYVATTTTVNDGTTTLTTSDPVVDKKQVVTIGESITLGNILKQSYPLEVQRRNPDFNVVNLGLSGATADELIRSDKGIRNVQLLPAIGALYFDFVDGLTYPFSEQNGATLSVDSDSLKIVRDATADSTARLKVTNIKQNITVTCKVKGDGTSNCIIKKTDGTVLHTGTTSTTYEDVTFNYKVLTDYEGIDFIVNGGASGGFVNVTDIEISDDDYVKTDSLLLMEGINDMSDGLTSAQIIVYLEFIIKHAQYQNVPIVGIGIHPVFGAYTIPADQATITALNDWTYNTAKYNHTVNLEDLGNASFELLPRYNSGDKLHCNDAGYIKMGELVNSQWVLGRSSTRKGATGTFTSVNVVNGIVESGTANELENVATGVWETPQDGVKYFADSNIGGFGDTVYYMQMSGVTGTLSPFAFVSSAANTYKAIVNYGGGIDTGLGTFVTFGYQGGSDITTVYIRNNSRDISAGMESAYFEKDFQVWFTFTEQ